jgi:hypothetical protein
VAVQVEQVAVAVQVAVKTLEVQEVKAHQVKHPQVLEMAVGGRLEALMVVAVLLVKVVVAVVQQPFRWAGFQHLQQLQLAQVEQVAVAVQVAEHLHQVHRVAKEATAE